MNGRKPQTAYDAPQRAIAAGGQQDTTPGASTNLPSVADREPGNPGRGMRHGRKILEALREATKPAMVQVAIGVWVPTLLRDAQRASRPSVQTPNPDLNAKGVKEEQNAEIAKNVPETCLAKWVETTEPGRFHLVPDEIRMVRLNSRTVRLLGFDGQWHTLINLAEAGFIEIVKVAPHVRMLNLDSWFNHVRRCAEDPDMWDAGSPCCEEYLKARRLLRRCGMVAGNKPKMKRREPRITRIFANAEKRRTPRP